MLCSRKIVGHVLLGGQRAFPGPPVPTPAWGAGTEASCWQGLCKNNDSNSTPNLGRGRRGIVVPELEVGQWQ